MKIISVLFLLSSVVAVGQPKSPEMLYAKSVGKLTMLAYGLGEDRLGSAKAGYIDTGILLHIIDSTKDLYLAGLSKFHAAWISKADLKADPNLKVKPFYLTNSISIKGDDVYDNINLNVDEKLPYKSWMETDPARIIVDVYGVQSNTNWITTLRSAKEIKSVVLSQQEDDVVRLTIELKHQQQWGYSISYKKNILSIRVRRQPAALNVRNLLIAVDAGHGGNNFGADGITSKVLEKNYTIRFANELEKYLRRKGASVIMTRTSDTSFNNIDRVLMLQNLMPHLLVSLHLNSSSNENVKGVSTYYKHTGYRSFASNILGRMLQLNLSEFGTVGSFNFTLNAPTDFPGALVEIGFLSNREDEKRILDPKFQKAVAKKIYKGISDWLKEIRKSD